MNPCYLTHPALKIGDFLIYGGRCADPVVKDADIYVGLDGMFKPSPKSYPWNEGESFMFYIQDQCAPANPAEFRKLIEWLAVQLTAQKKIHVGCIGGHGRTGMVLAALVKQVTGEEDSITYVRKNYCEKAVESKAQVMFLVNEWGIKEVAPREYPKYKAPVFTPHKGPPVSKGFEFPSRPINAGLSQGLSALKLPATVYPVVTDSTLWGSNVRRAP